jgi:hypothetical protein
MELTVLVELLHRDISREKLNLSCLAMKSMASQSCAANVILYFRPSANTCNIIMKCTGCQKVANTSTNIIYCWPVMSTHISISLFLSPFILPGRIYEPALNEEGIFSYSNFGELNLGIRIFRFSILLKNISRLIGLHIMLLPSVVLVYRQTARIILLAHDMYIEAAASVA